MPTDDLHPDGDPWIGEKFRSTDTRDVVPRVIFVHSLATKDGYPRPGFYSCELLDPPAYVVTARGRRRNYKASTLTKHWERVSH